MYVPLRPSQCEPDAVGNSGALLPDEILLGILNFIRFSSPPSLLNIARASHRLHGLAQPLVNRKLVFHFVQVRRHMNTKLIKRLLRETAFAEEVRETQILWAPMTNPSGDSMQEVHALMDVVHLLSSLETFVWDAQYPMPPRFVMALQKARPQCKLQVRFPHTQRLTPFIEKLNGMEKFYALRMDNWSLPRHAFQTLCSCQDLAELVIENKVAWEGFAANDQEAFKPLRLKSFEIMGLSTPHTTQWCGLTDWTQLQRLSMTINDRLPDFFKCLNNLRVLNIHLANMPYEDDMYLEFLLRCNYLEELMLTGFEFEASEWDKRIFSHLGRTLQAVRLHNGEIEGQSRHIIDAPGLELLAAACPRLQRLGLDLSADMIHRELEHTHSNECRHDWSLEQLKDVASKFWAIEHLEFNLELGLASRGKGVCPKATLKTVERIWKYMRQAIRLQRRALKHEDTEPRLRSMDIVSGSALSEDLTGERRGNGKHWEKQATQRFTIDLSERDDEAVHDIAKVRCAQLEALKTKFGRDQQVFQNEQQKQLFDNVWKRAHEGTLNYKASDMLMDPELTRPLSFWNTRDQRRFYYR